MLEVRNLTKRYYGVTAVSQVSFVSRTRMPRGAGT